MNSKIILGEPYEPELHGEVMPPPCLWQNPKQKIPNDDFQIYVVVPVYKRILDHLWEDRSIESGGVLVGHAFKSLKEGSETTFVIVSGFIRQESQRRSAVHFTVGPDEIQAARAVLAGEYPGLQVVGWYHSHPNHGVFLSGQDMSIVSGIYSATWHIALVIDPVREKEGFFIGGRGEPLTTRGGSVLWSQVIGLHKEPDCLIAMARYNLLLDALEENNFQQAKKWADEIHAILSQSDQLRHWQTGYRNVDELIQRAFEQSLHTEPGIPASGKSSLLAPLEVSAPEKPIADETVGLALKEHPSDEIGCTAQSKPEANSIPITADPHPGLLEDSLITHDPLDEQESSKTEKEKEAEMGELAQIQENENKSVDKERAAKPLNTGQKFCLR